MIQKQHFILRGAEDKTISGDITWNDEGAINKTVIFIHGFKGFKDWGTHNLVAERFASHGFRYLKFNLSHSGVHPDRPHDVTDLETFASNTVTHELRDVEAIIQYVTHTFTSDEIYLIGHSRGGGLAIIEAAKNKHIKKLVTWSAIADFASLWKPDQEEEWKKTGRIFVENARTKEKMPLDVSLLQDFKRNKEEYNIKEKAKTIRIPWLILHGDEDVNVSFSVAQELAQANPAACLKKIEGANHVYGGSHPFTGTELPPHLLEVCEKTIAFLSP
jgi:pimeloyl-ACP methyl ester carboxylesterase